MSDKIKTIKAAIKQIDEFLDKPFYGDNRIIKLKEGVFDIEWTPRGDSVKLKTTLLFQAKQNLQHLLKNENKR